MTLAEQIHHLRKQIHRKVRPFNPLSFRRHTQPTYSLNWYQTLLNALFYHRTIFRKVLLPGGITKPVPPINQLFQVKFGPKTRGSISHCLHHVAISGVWATIAFTGILQCLAKTSDGFQFLQRFSFIWVLSWSTRAALKINLLVSVWLFRLHHTFGDCNYHRDYQ